MREYPDNHRRFFDRGDDLQVAATLRAVFAVDIEHAPEQTRPAHARRRTVRVFACGLSGILRRAGHNCGTQPGIRGQHAVKADQMQARSRHQRGQAPHEFQWQHPDVRGAVAPRAFELQHDITSPSRLSRSIALAPAVYAPLPPRSSRGARSNTTTRAPCSCAASAAHTAALPPPTTTTSYPAITMFPFFRHCHHSLGNMLSMSAFAANADRQWNRNSPTLRNRMGAGTHALRTRCLDEQRRVHGWSQPACPD